jgi:hypothetical protein
MAAPACVPRVVGCDWRIRCQRSAVQRMGGFGQRVQVTSKAPNRPSLRRGTTAGRYRGSGPQTAPPEHSGLAAKRVAVGVLGGIVVAGIALAEGASWSVGALGATDIAALVFVAWVSPDVGIDFKEECPDYLDFAHLAPTIGMTFQVSDTDLLVKRVRRQALRHVLTSYVFGTVIVAITSARSLRCSAVSGRADRLSKLT